MAKASWAKVYVDLRHHPKLFARPDADFRLWTCLMLHAKEHCPDSIVRGLSAQDMRGMFGIKASVKVVEAALEYLAQIGWAVPVEGGLFLPNLEERQRAAGDTPEMHAKRQAKWRDAHKNDVTNKQEVTSHTKDGVTSPGQHEVTARDGSGSDADSDSDSDADPEEAKKIAAGAAAPALPAQQIEPRLLEGWPPGLLARVKDAVASTRKSGMISFGPWHGFLVRASGFSASIRVRSAEIYLDRNYASERKAEGYLIGIMKGETDQAQGALPMRGNQRGAAALQITDAAKAEHEISGRKML